MHNGSLEEIKGEDRFGSIKKMAEAARHEAEYQNMEFGVIKKVKKEARVGQIQHRKHTLGKCSISR